MSAGKFTLDMTNKYNLGEPVVYGGRIYYVLGLTPGRNYQVLTYTYVLGPMLSLDPNKRLLERVDDTHTIRADEYQIAGLKAVWDKQREVIIKELDDLKTQARHKENELANLEAMMENPL